MSFASALGSSFKSTLAEYMPYLAWAIIPAVIGTIKKFKPAWKDKVGDFWPVIAVVICILLNTVGIEIKPTDMDLPSPAPAGVHFQVETPADVRPEIIVPSRVEPLDAPRSPLYVTSSPAPAMTAAAPSPVQLEKVPETKPINWFMYLKVVALSLMGGLAASKAYDLHKLYKQRRPKEAV